MDQTSQAIQKKFQQYYLATTTKLGTPPRMEQREYGFLLFKEKFMVRHRAFRSPDSLLAAIRDLAPLHAYFSTGYYRDPTLPMEKKGWIGADLVFDIDADHLNTPCKTSHDNWKCKSCETSGQGSTPTLCPKCKNDRMETQTWLCEKCLQAAKEETQKLLEILYSDMGVDPGTVRIFFSGHRGYHIHVYSQDLVLLGEAERREIVDYVLGQGLDAKLHDLEETTSAGVRIVEGPLMGQPGWRGRIVAGIYDLLGQEISQIGLSPIQTKSLQSLSREELLRKPFWNSVKGIGLTTWQTIALKAVEKKSARIDTVVTTDVHRLIRLPGTLNGHTGLLSVSVPSDKLDLFDPFAESFAFHGNTRVRVKEAPEFRIGSSRYGPFRNETVELPEAGAVLLLCKRRAEPVA